MYVVQIFHNIYVGEGRDKDRKGEEMFCDGKGRKCEDNGACVDSVMHTCVDVGAKYLVGSSVDRTILPIIFECARGCLLVASRLPLPMLNAGEGDVKRREEWSDEGEELRKRLAFPHPSPPPSRRLSRAHAQASLPSSWPASVYGALTRDCCCHTCRVCCGGCMRCF